MPNTEKKMTEAGGNKLGTGLAPTYRGGPRSVEGKERSSLNPLKHGLFAKSSQALKLRSRRTRYLFRKVSATLPWLQPSDMPVLRSWCELEIIGASIFTILESADVISGKDENGDLRPRRLLNEYARIKGLQLQYASALGMGPGARATLRLDAFRGDDLAQELAKERGANDKG